MRSCTALLLVSHAVLMLSVGSANAAAAAPSTSQNGAPPSCSRDRSACEVAADGNKFTAAAERQRQPARTGTAQPASPRTPATRTVDDGVREESLLVPTCADNAPGVSDVLCTLAVTGCPAPDQVRFWVYRRTITPATQDPPWQRLAIPPYVCVAPTEPGAPPFDPVAAVAASIEREFAQRAVLRGDAVVSPSPRTLVNVPTRLRTSAAESYPITFELFGLPVTIEVQAERWSWVTGDGEVVVTTARGTGGAVEHEYTQVGDLAPRVDITWSGTWSVPGVAPQSVPGTVTTQGEPGAVQVLQARSELVAG